MKRLNLSYTFLAPILMFLFSITTIAQRNITTVRINDKIVKKSSIVDSLGEWLTKKDLKKADSCLQILFNAAHRKDSIAGIRAANDLMEIIASKKYEEDFALQYNGTPPFMISLICILLPSRCYIDNRTGKPVPKKRAE